MWTNCSQYLKWHLLIDLFALQQGSWFLLLYTWRCMVCRRGRADERAECSPKCLMLQNVALESGGESGGVRQRGASYTVVSAWECRLPGLTEFVEMSRWSPSGFQARCKHVQTDVKGIPDARPSQLLQSREHLKPSFSQPESKPLGKVLSDTFWQNLD